jgi:hypothetical protein
MGTRPLAQRLYDKSKSDLTEFRTEMGEWITIQASNGFEFSGSAVDIFWQRSQTHLQGKVAEYFEWIEKESSAISPSDLKRESIDQCVGAVVTHSRQVRRTTVEMNRRLQKLTTDVDHGSWLDTNDNSIRERGKKLLSALGLGPSERLSTKLNHFVNDQEWLPLLISIVGIIISIFGFAISVAAFFRK